MEGFSIRLITTKTEFENIVTKAMLKEQWRVGLYDSECYLAADPTGTFVGELNGKPVGCVVLTKYGDNFGFIGGYIVSEECRGKGYGKKIFDTAMASVKPSRNVALTASPSNAEKMYENSGFHGLFNVICFDFHLASFGCFLEASERSPVNISSMDEVNENALFEYDSVVFGYPRHAFLNIWFRKGSYVKIAMNDESSIVGYIVARTTIIKDHGYNIGPLFADSESIAEELLKSVFKELLQQSELPPIVGIDVPQQNTQGIRLAETFQGKMAYTFAYMTTQGSPSARFDKWYGMTDLNLG